MTNIPIFAMAFYFWPSKSRIWGRIFSRPCSKVDNYSNKTTGSDGISGQMLLLCDDSVILLTSIYSDTWKLANVIPIFKKGHKQLIKNYRPISLLPICG